MPDRSSCGPSHPTANRLLIGLFPIAPLCWRRLQIVGA